MEKVITDSLKAVYQSFWFVLLLSVLIMFAYKNSVDIKDAIKKWLTWFKTEGRFRRVFYFIFYTVFVLFRTLFNRTPDFNPLSDIMGDWSFYKEDAGKTVFNHNVPENIMMLIPFIILFFLAFREKVLKHNSSFLNILLKSIQISFIFSFSVETMQLFLHLGTWQLSDLVYNTLGGIIGGVIYFIVYKIVVKHRNKGTSDSRGDKYDQS